ncbi:MAG: beta-CASP ribonuclease aCPSF1 [Candidatus Woesearchaeota archaeon]
MVSEIIKEIMKDIPSGKISDAVFEGANVVLYTKDKEFLIEGNPLMKEIVNKIKKRIELRADPSICEETTKAQKIIEKLIPEEAKADQIIFDLPRAVVFIESTKPGVAIGKQASILHEIKQKTCWTPIIRRTPTIRSQLIENIRSVLYENNDQRRKFLNECGERIYNGWQKGRKEEWVRVSFLGSGRQVGRSAILLQTPESNVLLDCGINPAGYGNDNYPILEAPEFDISKLDAVIISHAHLDHTGFLPYLFKFGYRGPVYCTTPTRDFMSLLQLDMIKIMANQGLDPIYGSEDVKNCVLHTIALDFEEVTDITPDVRITMYNSGHILGSAQVHLHIGNGLHNFLYSADQKYGPTRLLNPAVTKFPRVESLLIESTYAAKEEKFSKREDYEEELISIVKDTFERKGKVLVPVLGVGRAQEIMLILYDYIKKGIIENVPIYIDGMVWDINAITTAYPEYLNKDIRNQIIKQDDNPFTDPMFIRVGSRKERQDLLENKGSCVILATSGMLVGGASQEYFEFLAPDKRHSIVFVSYQGPGSLGRRVQQGEKDIMCSINNKKADMIHVKMSVHSVEGLSGHSSKEELLEFVKKCSPQPRKIMINHGESSACLTLASAIHRKFRIETIAPKNLEAIRLR